MNLIQSYVYCRVFLAFHIKYNLTLDVNCTESYKLEMQFIFFLFLLTEEQYPTCRKVIAASYQWSSIFFTVRTNSDSVWFEPFYFQE